MCKLYNYKAVWLYGKMAVWPTGYKPRREKAIGQQSNMPDGKSIWLYSDTAIRSYGCMAIGV